MVGGVLSKVFIGMTVGGRGGRFADGRETGTRYDLRRHPLGGGADAHGNPGEELGGLGGAQRHTGDELLGGPLAAGTLQAPFVHEALVLELTLGPGEGGCSDTGAFGGAREGLARSLGEGELPGQEADRVGRQPGVPDELVGELGEGARGRDMVPVNHGWSRFPLVVQALANGSSRCGGRIFLLTVQHGKCSDGRIE